MDPSFIKFFYSDIDKLVAGIAPVKKKSKPTNIYSSTVPRITSFDDMKLDDNILRGIYSYGFEKPSDIQQRAITPIIAGHDVVAQSQSGMGKTACFVIAALQRIDCERAHCQVLIISAVRELAQQTALVIKHVGAYTQGLTVHLCIGGTSVSADTTAVRKGVHIVSGMPGRVQQLVQNGALKVDKLGLCVLDEADVLLTGKLRDTIYDCHKYFPKSVQWAWFSTTVDDQLLTTANAAIMLSPKYILISQQHLVPTRIKQWFIHAQSEEFKFEILLDLFSLLGSTNGQIIVFTNTRRKTDWLVDKINEKCKITVCGLHCDLCQTERELVLKEFRTGSARVMVTTNAISRGIDIHALSIVVNYDCAKSGPSYIHRMGRCGRFGRKGCVISLTLEEDVETLDDIRQYYDTEIKKFPQSVDNIM